MGEICQNLRGRTDAKNDHVTLIYLCKPLAQFTLLPESIQITIDYVFQINLDLEEK